MTTRKVRRPWLFYPEDESKARWDIFLTFVLLLSCFITPYRIAFGELVEPIEWRTVSYACDVCFLIDMIILFNTAYYNDEFEIVEDKKSIASYYLCSWFIVDLLAVVPFDDFIQIDTSGITDVV